MFKKVAGTVITRLITAVLTLTIVIVNARVLGPEKVGTISLILLAITIISMVNNFVGGAALAYYTPRTSLSNLYLPSVIWALLTAVVVGCILQVTGSIPSGFFVHVILLSILQSLGSVNNMILLGKERIRAVNSITVVQVLSLAIVIGYFFLFTGNRDVMVYVYAMYASFALIFLWSTFLVAPRFNDVNYSEVRVLMKEVFRYGTWAQVGNVLQLFNYRSSFYFIELFLGKAALGVYSVGAQISEGVWLISRSMSMVQFARISNAEDKEYSARLTLLFVKFSVLITFLAIGIILVLPSSFFILVFGIEFAGIRLVMMSMAVGIVMLSASIVISPYFSGTGKPFINTIASGLGLIFTIALGFLLVPRMGITGAGVAASVAYTVTTLFQVVVFIRHTHCKAADFLITSRDINLITREFKGSLSKDV
jgi:O-antigen/teichoic acid export membrane protein